MGIGRNLWVNPLFQKINLMLTHFTQGFNMHYHPLLVPIIRMWDYKTAFPFFSKNCLFFFLSWHLYVVKTSLPDPVSFLLLSSFLPISCPTLPLTFSPIRCPFNSGSVDNACHSLKLVSRNGGACSQTPKSRIYILIYYTLSCLWALSDHSPSGSSGIACVHKLGENKFS